MRLAVLLLAFLLCSNLWAQNTAAMSQAQLAELADDTELTFAVVTNFDGKKSKLSFKNASSISLPAGKADWKIYFHYIRKIDTTVSAGLRVKHVQGDLHEIAPTEQFAGLPAGTSLEIHFSQNAHMVTYTDFMPRAFIAWPGLKAEVFANTDTENPQEYVAPITTPEQQLRNNNPDLFLVATAESRFVNNQIFDGVKLDQKSAMQAIIPTPLQVKYSRGTATLNNQWKIRYAGRLTKDAEYLKNALEQFVGGKLNSQPDHIAASGPTIYLSVDADLKADKKGEPLGEEAYSLTIEEDEIRIVGGGNAGAFYGIQTLLNLIPADSQGNIDLTELEVIDAPRAGWRGMHYDMGRNFHNKEVTLRMLEQMARYKLNKFHMHLTDDEGWRIEIPGLPELTQIGANRCFDLKEDNCLLTQLGTGAHASASGNGFYSTEDFVEILKFAAVRHIEVIPEIDMPGHGRAAIKSMEARYRKLLAGGQKAKAEQYLLSDPEDKSQYITVQNYTDNSINVCLPSTYAFIDKVMYELQSMYRTAGLQMKIFHMGGDEVGKGSWSNSPACNNLFETEEGVAGVADLKPYFVSKVAKLASVRGLSIEGWEDGLMYDATNTFNREQFENKNVIANAWDNIWEWGVADRAYRLANNGYQVVMSQATHLYFDHPYETHPEERGYYWAARYTDTRKVFNYMPDNLYANADTTKDGQPINNLEAMVGRELPKLKKPENILGIQGQVWSETIRTADQLEKLVYPRLIALAERAWHKASWEGDTPDRASQKASWAGFAHTLAIRELPKLSRSGVGFHLLPPGASLKNGVLKANAEFPGLVIEYSLDGGNSWQPYTAPVSTDSKSVKLRTRSGNTLSRTTTVN
ncbi:Chitobiase [Thalassocella blandensis]|nr:Chitobiase [Thalassocella blandensis]